MLFFEILHHDLFEEIFKHLYKSDLYMLLSNFPDIFRDKAVKYLDKTHLKYQQLIHSHDNFQLISVIRCSHCKEVHDRCSMDSSIDLPTTDCVIQEVITSFAEFICDDCDRRIRFYAQHLYYRYDPVLHDIAERTGVDYTKIRDKHYNTTMKHINKQKINTSMWYTTGDSRCFDKHPNIGYYQWSELSEKGVGTYKTNVKRYPGTTICDACFKSKYKIRLSLFNGELEENKPIILADNEFAYTEWFNL